MKIDDKYLEKSNQNLSAIFKFCYPSPVHHKELKKISDLFGSKIRQFSLMKNVRWTGSRAWTLTIIETNYEVLNSDLDSKWYETRKSQATLTFILSALSPGFVLYFKVSFIKVPREQALSCEVSRVSDVRQELDFLLVICHESSKRLMSHLSQQTHDVVSTSARRLYDVGDVV